VETTREDYIKFSRRTVLKLLIAQEKQGRRDRMAALGLDLPDENDVRIIDESAGHPVEPEVPPKVYVTPPRRHYIRRPY